MDRMRSVLLQFVYLALRSSCNLGVEELETHRCSLTFVVVVVVVDPPTYQLVTSHIPARDGTETRASRPRGEILLPFVSHARCGAPCATGDS